MMNLSRIWNNELLMTRKGQLRVFILLWLVAFAAYLPAAKAGLVGDMPYLFDSINNQGFLHFVSIKDGIALYQVAALNFYLLIKAFGTHVWLWHIFYVSMHAFIGLLTFIFFSRLLSDSGMRHAGSTALVAVLLFIICPHGSEVVVWDASNHHSVATALIFGILVLTQLYLKEQRPRYAVISALLFLYATFSHEFFYLIPCFVLLLLCYYRFALGYPAASVRKAFLYFFVPLLLLFLFHLGLLRAVKHTYVSHFGKLDHLPLAYYLNKPVKYVFHVFFFGRYFPLELRRKIYEICEQTPVLIAFYSVFIGLWGYTLVRLSRVSVRLKLVALISAYLLIVFLFLSPVAFADSQLVCYDRYVYPSLGFACLLLVLLAGAIPVRTLRLGLLGGYCVLSLWLLEKVNIYWKQSAYVIKKLINEMPDPGNKTVLILNLPDDMNGIPMIAAQEDGRFRLMKNVYGDKPVSNKVYDVVAYNMSTMNDGAHVNVINDSMMHVTLNQWGTWWLYGLFGANSYETPDYRLNMIDEGHWYELTLKKPADRYLLLYQVGAQWKVVDWNNKNKDQE